MPVDPQHTTYFRHARFSTRLPNAYRYAPSHYWIAEIEPAVFRVGMTRFATRMLGDFVELNFDVEPNESIHVGQPIGSVEGFKAVADVYSAIGGDFLGGNPQLLEEPELVDRDPYAAGWLYLVRGNAKSDLLDVAGYVGLLTATIDRMLEQQKSQEKKQC